MCTRHTISKWPTASSIYHSIIYVQPAHECVMHDTEYTMHVQKVSSKLRQEQAGRRPTEPTPSSPYLDPAERTPEKGRNNENKYTRVLSENQDHTELVERSGTLKQG